MESPETRSAASPSDPTNVLPNPIVDMHSRADQAAQAQAGLTTIAPGAGSPLAECVLERKFVDRSIGRSAGQFSLIARGNRCVTRRCQGRVGVATGGRLAGQDAKGATVFRSRSPLNHWHFGKIRSIWFHPWRSANA